MSIPIGFCRGLEGVEVTLHCPRAECMCAYTIYVSALLPLFLLLAQGTCSSRPWDLPGLRLSNAFKVSQYPPAPSCHGARVECAESSAPPAVLRGCQVPLCALLERRRQDVLWGWRREQARARH